MSAEKIRTALATIQQNPSDSSAWDVVEEVVTGDGGADVVRELEMGRVWHERLKQWPVVAKLLDLEVALDDDPSIVAAKQLELARIYHEELMDGGSADSAYKRASELKPGEDKIKTALGEIDFGRSNLDATVEQAMVEALDSDDDKVRVPMLVRAAEYTFRYGAGDDDAMGKVSDWIGQALALDANHPGALAVAANVYRVAESWEELADVLGRRVSVVKDKDDKIGAAHAYAVVVNNHLEDDKRRVAAHTMLIELDPANRVALQFLADHYTKTEEWDHLAALYEDQLAAGAQSDEEELGALVQLAMLNWRTREKPEAAEPFFDRVRRAEPTHAGMLSFFRERLTESEPGRLMSILTDAQRAAADNDAKARLAEEIASLAEGQENARRAIEQYKTVLRNDPDNSEARDKLKNLYLETESYNALVELLRQELGRYGDDEPDARAAVLWEIAAIYRDRVQSDTSLLTVLTQILQIDESDVEAVRGLLKVYESLGRWRDLLQTQQRLAELTNDAGEKVRLLRAVARRWLDQFSNAQNAISAYEALLEADSDDVEAREKLRELYQKRRAWDKLYDLYELMLEGLEGDGRAGLMGEMAKLAAERLGKGEEAIRLLKEVLVFDPDDTSVLDQLERQAERQKDFPTVAYVLEKRVGHADDPKAQLSILQKLGVLYADKMGKQEKAQGAWRRVLDLSPGHKRALRVLRQSFVASKDWDGLTELYTSQDDFEGLADFLSTTADKSKDEGDKVELSFRAAGVYEDQLGAPERAARSYERVLTIDGSNIRAAERLLPIYEDDEKWSRLPALHEVLLDASEDVDVKIGILAKMAEITGGPLSNKAGALAYARKAYELRPDDAALETLRDWSQEAGEWSTFTEVVQGKLEDDATTPERARELKLMIASVYGAEVEKIDDAVAMYRQLLEADPTDEATARAFEDLLRAADRRDDLRWLFELKVEQTEGETKCEALEEWATVEEEVFGEPEKAVELLRRVVAEDAARTSALATLTRLLIGAEDYPSAATMMAKHRDASDGQERVELETRLAELYLEHLDEPTQAYEASVRALAIDQQHEPAIELLEQLLDVPETRARSAQSLEKIYGDAGEADKQAQALRAMLESVDDGPRRLELCQRLADVHEHQLDDAGGAFDVILAALLEVKNDVTLWDRARGLSEAAGRPTDLAEAYRQHLAAPGAAEDESADADSADADSADADSADTDSADTDSADAESEGAEATEEAATAAPTEPPLSEELQLELCERAAVLHEEQLGDPEGAIPYLERMLTLDPRSQTAFDRLKAILNAVERWADLEQLYQQAIEVTEDEASKIDLLHQAALVSEDMIGNDDKAIGYFEAIVEMDPIHLQATEALERLYGRDERYDKLAALLERRLETAMDDEAAPILQQLIDLYLHQLETYDRVIGHLERCLQLDKDDHDVRSLAEECLEVPQLRQQAAGLLDDLYVSIDDPRDLVRVLGVRLEAAEGEEDRRELLRRIATLRDERLKDDAGAFEALCELMPLEPDDTVIRERLIDIGRRLGEAEKMAAALLATADKATMPSVQGEVLMEAANLYRDRLDDPKRAEEVYRRALGIDPEDPDLVIPASTALAGIYREEGKHEALAQVLQTQVKLVSDGDEIRNIYARIANLYEDLLEDDQKAIEAWKARVAEDDHDQPALAALERLYERTEAWTELVEVLRSLEQAATDGDERKRCMIKAAEVLAGELAQTEEAIDAWRAVQDDFGPEPDTLAALAKLYEKGERWQDLAETYESWLAETDEVDDRVRLFASVGDVRRQHLDDPHGALGAYREVLTIEPGHAQARGSLEKLLEHEDPDIKREAAEIIGPLYDADGAAESLLKVLDIEIESTYDPAGKLDTLKRALMTAEDTMGNEERAFGYASRGVREALGEPALAEWIDTVERLAAETERWADLLKLYEEVVADMLDEEVQQTVRLRAGELSRGRLDDADRAIGHYRAALETNADDQRAMIALEELYGEKQDNESLLEILQLRAEAAESDEDRVELLFRVAELQAGPLEQSDDAITTYEDLTNLSLEERAVEALEGLYAKAERYDDLVALYERVLDDVSGEGAADVRVKIARVSHDKIGDTMRALDELGDALGADQDHAGAIAELEKMLETGEEPEQRGRVAEMLEPVYLASHDWGKLKGVLEARLEVTLDPVDRGELLSRLATLYEEQLEDYGAALETVAKRLREEPTDEDIRAEVERLGRVLGDESERRVAEIFASALEEVTSDEPSTASLAARTGELFAAVDENDKALSWYRRAYDFDPESTELFEAIDALLVKLSRREDRIEHYRAALDHTFDDDVRVAYLHTIAKLQRELEQDDEAISTLIELLDIEERNEEALDSLTELYVKGERSDDLADLYERRAELADEPDQGAPHRLALAKLLQQTEDGKDRALDQLDIIVTDLPDHEGAIAELEGMLGDRERKQRVIDLLRPLYERAENWQGLITLDKELLSLAEDPIEQVDVLMNTAALWEDQGEDLTKAFDVVRKAFLLQPDNEDARATVERLAENLEAWDALADAYTEAAEKVEDEFTKRPLLSALAEVSDQKLDDPRRSLNALMALSELDPGDPEPLEQMDLLCSLLGDWDTLATVVEKKAENAGDEDRASLLRRLGGIKHDMLGQTDEAIRVYEEALDVMPDSKVTLDHLIALHADRDARRLVELLEQRVGVTDPSEDERHDLILQAAAVYEDKLEERQEAIRVLQLALDERPTDRDVLGRMAKLYEAEEMHDSLLENLKTQASVSEEAEERLALRNRIGDLFLAEFDNAFDALEQYRMVLDEDEENAHAIEKCQHIATNYEELRLEVAALLEPVLQGAGRHADLVAMMELRLSAQTDPTDRAQTLSGIALIQEEQLDDAEASRDTLLRALAEVPDDSHVHDEVNRLCELTDEWGKYADVLAERAEATFDALVQTDLYTRLGRIAEEQLDDKERAIEAYSNASDQAAEPGDLLEALDRLYVATEKWEELGQVLERRADLEQDDGERAGFFHRLGALQIERFDDKEQGLGTLRMASDLNPEHAGVREALEGLTDDESLFEEVAEILDNMYRVAQDSQARAKLRNKRISYAPTASERVRLRLELAQMLEDESFDTKSAQDVIQQALNDDATDPELLAQLERLATTNAAGEEGDAAWNRAADALGEAVAASLTDEVESDMTPDLARDLYLRTAGWYKDKVDDVDKAEKRLREALGQDEEHAETVLALEEIHRGEGREKDLVETLRKLAALVQAGADAEGRSHQELRKEAKLLAETPLEDAALAEAILRDMLQADDADEWALTELSEVCETKGDHAELYRLIMRRLELMPEPDLVRELRHQAAKVAAEQLDDKEGAIDLYEQAFEDDPKDEDAADALRSLYEKLERYEDMLRFIERLLDMADTPEERAELRLESARICIDIVSAPSEGIDHLNAVLDEIPAHAGAVEQLSKMLEKEQRDDELADLLNKQIDLAKEAGDQDKELGYRVQLSELYETRLNDPDKAIEGYLGVLETDAAFRPALEALARLYEQQDETAKAAEVNEKLLDGADDEDLTRLALKAKELFVAVDDRAAGCRVLEAVADKGEAIGADNLAAIRDGLHTLYRESEEWAKLAELVETEAGEAEGDDDKVALYRKAAEIHSKERDDHARAAELLDKAVELKDDDRDLMLLLCDEYTKSGRGKAAIEVLQKVVESYGGRRSKELADIHHRIASAYLAEGDQDAALGELESARKMDPGSVTILYELGTLSLRMAEAEDDDKADHVKRAGNAFRSLLLQRLDAGAPVSKADVFYNLARVSQADGDMKKAKQMADRAISNDKEHEGAKALLEELG